MDLIKPNFIEKKSSKNILFSIPVHENQDVIHNHIENIMNLNPNAKIILHINKSFTDFSHEKIKFYDNVYVNKRSFKYIHGQGLLWIHINNFLEAIELKIDFDFFSFLSSNEMFIKEGLIDYIETHENGTQTVPYDENHTWHNFHNVNKSKSKNLIENVYIKKLLEKLNLQIFYGGQSEGQFYTKDIFQKISDIYLDIFGYKELFDFETEEIICQTIFMSFVNSKLVRQTSLPYTLQNYSNDIQFDEKFIDKLRNNSMIIPNKHIPTTLESPHINKDSSSVFSIKRVNRTFNNIRDYLSKKGFILNDDVFIKDINYYSNSSKIRFFSPNHLYFKKHGLKNYNWFGFNLSKGKYHILFDIKINNYIPYSEKIGFKLHKPNEIIYNDFFENLTINDWSKKYINFNIEEEQLAIFIFDDISSIEFEMKGVKLGKNFHFPKQDSVIIFLNDEKRDYNNYHLYSYNLYNNIINPLSKKYNVLLFITTDDNTYVNELRKHFKPFNIFISNGKQNYVETISENISKIYDFQKLYNIKIEFSIFLKLNIFIEKSIYNLNFDANKINFLCYSTPYIDNKICNDGDLLIINNKHLNSVSRALKYIRDIRLLYHELSDKNDIHFIDGNNYNIKMDKPYIKTIQNMNNINNNEGYLLSNSYIRNVIYKNNYSRFIEKDDNEYYFHKYSTLKSESWQWLGYFIENSSKSIKIFFEIKFINELPISRDDKNNQYGIKIHKPLSFHNNWIRECKLNEYSSVLLTLDVNPENQHVILNFDNYYGEVIFYIKNFVII